tara:strand:+ start:1610 stop:1873 length:264 start_codon:yes stop_codon:yes gene_type:complete
MTQKELIEMVQMHHPTQGETIIRSELNKAQDDFTAKTQILDAVGEDTIVADKRYYDLDPDMLEIKRVEVNNISIKRIITPPVEGDLT